MPGGQLLDERIGDPGKRVINRVANVPVPDADPVRPGHELSHGTVTDRVVDHGQRVRRRGTFFDNGVGDFAQRGPDIPHAVQRAVGAVHLLRMDEPARRQPLDRVIGCLEVVDECTVFELGCVQEVEGVIELHPMVMPGEALLVMRGCHVGNHYMRLDRLRASG